MRPVRVSNYILICAHSKIRIAEARVGFKAANRESFPYIMHIVDEPRKFSPSNVLTYTVYVAYSQGKLWFTEWMCRYNLFLQTRSHNYYNESH